MRYNNQDLLTAGNQMLGIEGFGGCTLSEYHGYLLKLLTEIDRICRKNNILYFLMYGSLIGAVRHHGFVPWDDDADIIMTRHEFNKFRECCKTELGEEFVLVTYNDDDNYNYTFPKLRLKNTTYIIRSEISRHGRSAGFFIDIILMDYVPKNRLKALIQRRTAIALHRLVSPGFFQSSIGLNRVENALVALSKLILGKKNSIKIAEKIISSADPEKCDQLLAEIFMPSEGYFYLYDRYHFDKSEPLTFENTTLQVPTDPITLLHLHKCYFKRFIEYNTILNYKYDDEIEAINSGKAYHCNDIMFIPEERSRDRHIEVIFDCNHDSTFYDSFYFSKFDKKENDKCAVRERKQREKIRSALKTMEINDKIAKQSCREALLLEYLKQIMSDHPDPYSVPIKDLITILNDILKLKIIFSNELSVEQSKYILSVLIICGYGMIAKRLALFLISNNPDIDLSSQLRIIDQQFEAFYAIFENNNDMMNKYIDYGYNDLFSLVLRGIILYNDNNYEEAEKLFLNYIIINDTGFWAEYYLGLIELNIKNNINKARTYFISALNSTTFMPQLQLAINKIKEIDNASNKQTVSC